MRARSFREISGRASSRLRYPTRRRRPSPIYTTHASAPAARRAAARGKSPSVRATASTSQYSILSLIHGFRMAKDQCSGWPELFAVLGCNEVLGNIPHEGHRARGHGNVAFENRLKAVRLPEEDFRVLGVLAHAGAVEIDAGEEPLAARVGEQLCSHLPVGRGLGIASHRAGGCGGVGANLELVLEQILKAALIHCDQHEVGRLAADLQSPGAARHADEHRRAPAMTGAAGYHALSILRAEDERALDEAGDHAHAGSLAKNVQGDASVLGGENLIEHGH